MYFPHFFNWEKTLLLTSHLCPCDWEQRTDICSPTSTVLGFRFLCNLASTCWFVYDGHCDWCEVVFHCGFDMHLYHGWWCWDPFMYLWALWMSSLGKCLFRSFAHFLNCIDCLLGVESCEFFIYFEIKPLSEISLANIYSHTVSSFFFFYDGFCRQAEAF